MSLASFKVGARLLTENDDDASADQRLCFGSSKFINKNNNSVRLALVLEKK